MLASFESRRQPETTRKDYVSQLTNDMASYYGYLPELVQLFLDVFPPNECLQFLEANEVARPVTIRYIYMYMFLRCRCIAGRKNKQHFKIEFAI